MSSPIGPETEVLKNLVHVHVPKWVSLVEGFIARGDKKAEEATQVQQDEDEAFEEDVIGPAPAPRPKAEFTVSHHSAELEKAVRTTGPDREHQAPQYGKVRFSSLTGPTIYYDGEGQQFLYTLWNLIAEQRGGLRKEMMAIRKKIPTERPRYKPLNDITEATDGLLDKATRFIETSSLLMLKGEPYRQHMGFIMARFKEAAEKVSVSGLMEPRPPSPPPIAYTYDDESDGDGTLEADDCEDDEEEQPVISIPVSRYSRAGGRMPPRAPPRMPPRMPPSRIQKKPMTKITVEEVDDKLEADEALEVDDEIEIDTGDSDTSMPDIKLKLPPRRVYGPPRSTGPTAAA